jgi:O-antigen/teichoic acid export membrane protein
MPRFRKVLPQGSLRRRLAAGAFWSIVGSGLSQAFALAATVLSARLLGASQYGELGIVITTVNLFATVATVGLGVTSTKYVAEYRTSHPERAGKIVGISAVTAVISGLLVALTLTVGAGWIATVTLDSPGLAAPLRWAATLMFVSTMSGAQTGALSGFEAFKFIATGSVVRGIVTLPAVALGIWAGGLIGAIIGYTVAAAAGSLTLEILLRRKCRLHGVVVDYAIDADGLRLLWRFSVPALIAGLSFTPATWWANALLVTRGGFVENGIFNAARQWQTLVLFLSSSVANLGLPMLANVAPHRDHPKYLKYLGANFALTSGLAVVTAIPVAASSNWIMSFYGPEFAGRGIVLTWICAGAVLMALNAAVGQAIWSLNAARAGMLLAILRGGALVAAAYLLVDRGAEGLAGAYVAMGLIQTLTQAPFMAWLLRRQRREWSGG